MYSINLDETRSSYSFFIVIFTTIILTWLPTKIIGYFMPFIILFIFGVTNNNIYFWYKSISIFLFLLLIIISNYIFRDNYLLHSGLLSIITFGGIIVTLIIPSKNYYDSKYSFDLYNSLAKKVIITQSMVGIFQLILGIINREASLDSDTGDVVQGTIHPFSFLADAAMGFGNQMFVINILLLITYFIPSITYNKSNILPTFLGFITITLASVLHLTASWLAALIFVYIFFNPNIFNKYFLFILIVTLSSILIVYYTQPSNFSLIERYAIEYFSGESLKIIATYEALVEMPNEYPLMHYFGVGPGQFSSKAGLIGTGQYFGEFYNPTEIPLLPQKISDPFQKYGYALWEYTNRPDIVKWINSTMNRTFYSILSLYTELGLFIFGAILFYILKTLFFLKSCYLNNTFSKLQKVVSFCTAINIVFICFICFFENYLESSQAIFTGLLLIKLNYGYLKNI